MLAYIKNFSPVLDNIRRGGSERHTKDPESERSLKSCNVLAAGCLFDLRGDSASCGLVWAVPVLQIMEIIPSA